MKKQYCTQSRFGFFGARWACAVASLGIVNEHIRCFFQGKSDWQITDMQIELICGRFLLLGNARTMPPVYVCNYKNHQDIWDNEKPDDGWGMDADPEAHFLIRDWKWAYAEMARVQGINLQEVPTERYGLLVVDVDGNPYDKKVSTHFEPLFDGEVISNPDPRLEGFPEVERRALPV